MAEAKPTPDQRVAILKQLECMLTHHAFKNSKRCTALLRYLVEQALENPTVHIKERTLGIDVFGRDASYDTALDPIVRMTASEIRKRIAQYYHEVNRENELRIELPAGFYMPEFRFVPSMPVPAVQQETVPEVTPEEDSPLPVTPPSEPKKRFSRTLVGVIIAVAVVLTLAGTIFSYWVTQSNFSLIWYPLLRTPGRVLICVGTTSYPPGTASTSTAPIDRKSITAAQTTPPDSALPRKELPINDVNSISKIIGVLEKGNKTYELLDAASSTLADLRAGPVVLVGVFDNDWTRRLSAPLRFNFEEDAKLNRIRIRDSYNPTRDDWSVVQNQSYKDLKKDYAVVSRYSDQVTGTPVLQIAGLRSYGTNIAAEFVNNPRYLNAVGKKMAGCKHNIQFVLEADIIDGISGPPQVLAVHCW